MRVPTVSCLFVAVLSRRLFSLRVSTVIATAAITKVYCLILRWIYGMGWACHRALVWDGPANLPYLLVFVGLTSFGLVRCGSGVMSGSEARTALPPEDPGRGTGWGSVSASSSDGKTAVSRGRSVSSSHSEGEVSAAMLSTTTSAQGAVSAPRTPSPQFSGCCAWSFLGFGFG